MTIYGHYFLSFIFRPVVELNEKGFIYKNRQYDLKDISSVQESSSLFLNYFLFPVGTPKAKVILKDGSVIKLNGRVLGVKGEKMHVNFVTNKSVHFEELVALFQSEIG